MTSIQKFTDVSGEALFILQCTVKKTKASNLKTVIPDNSTSVLKIDQVFRAPSVLGDIRNKQITVKLMDTRVKEGQQFVLTGRYWQVGSNLALVETERLTTKIDTTAFRQQVTEKHLLYLNSQIENRLSKADMVVAGKITSVEKVRSRERYKLDDKAEDWYEAKIFVTSLLKGRLRKSAETSVWFPGVQSEKRYGIPKFSAGQEGIWILHQKTWQGSGKEGKRENYFAAPDPLDFHLLNQLSRITTLLARSK